MQCVALYTMTPLHNAALHRGWAGNGRSSVTVMTPAGALRGAPHIGNGRGACVADPVRDN